MLYYKILYLFIPILFFACIPGYVQGEERIQNSNAFPQQVSELYFLENAGQLTDAKKNPRYDIHYKMKAGNGLNIFIANGTIYYQWTKVNIDHSQESEEIKEPKIKDVEFYQLRMQLIGANPNAQRVAEDVNDYYENYYLPQCPSGATANSYRKITYKNIYPHIDWVLYTKNGEPGAESGRGLKYDFIVHPGGNPSDIKMKYYGDTAINVDHEGITVHTPFGSVQEDAPYSYEEESKNVVESHFLVDGNEISIGTGEYSGTLVIDPTLRWFTYFGGWFADEGLALARKDRLSVVEDLTYMAGRSQSWENIVVDLTQDVHQVLPAGTQNDGNDDGFIAAFQFSGKRKWATYYGGERNDVIYAMVADKAGYIYVGGSTKSTAGIATPGAYQTSSGGAIVDLISWYDDAFFAKFDSTGKRVWGSYFGGERWDEIFAMALDSDANLYLTGVTQSYSDIVSPGAYQSNNGGYKDAFFAKFDSSGNRQWATYYGKDSVDEGKAVVCDNKGSVYFGGFGKEGFLVKLRADNGSLIWKDSSYCPALAYDSSGFYDTSGNYIQGMLYAGGNGVRAIKPGKGLYWNTAVSATALFLYKPASLLAMFEKTVILMQSGMVQRTMMLGNNRTRLKAITVDNLPANGDPHLYVTGQTTQEGKAYGTQIHQDELGDAPNTTNGDAFLMQFQVDDQPFQFYIGTIVPPPPVVGIDPPLKPPLKPFFPTLFRRFCTGDSVIVLPLVYFAEPFPHGTQFIIQLSDSSGSFAKSTRIGVGKDTFKCAVPPGVPAGKNYKVRMIALPSMVMSITETAQVFNKPFVNASSNSPVCEGDTLFLNATDTINGGVIHYQWTDKDTNHIFIAKDTFLANIKPVTAGKFTIVAIADEVCNSKSEINVIVKPLPTIVDIGNSGPVCEGEELQVFVNADTTGGGTFTWTGPGFNSTQQNPVLENPTVNNTGLYYTKFTKYGCTATDSTMVLIDTLPEKPIAGSNSPLCYGDTLKLTVDNVQQRVNYLWNGPANFSSTLPGHYILNSTDGISGEYIIRATKDKCSNADSILVIVKPQLPPPDVTSNSPVKAGDELRLYAGGPAGANYSWAGPDSFYSNEQNPVIKFVPFTGTGQYRVAMNVDGCTSSGGITVVVNTTSEVFFVLFPNPNNGNFTIKATLNNDQVVPLDVVTVTGQKVYETKLISTKRLLVAPVSLLGSLSSGDYYLRIRTDGGDRVIPFSIVK